MKASETLLPLYYGSIRQAVLDFTGNLYAKGHDACFADGQVESETEETSQFTLTVFKGRAASSEPLFELTYVRGQEIMAVKSSKIIEDFEDGVYISDGYWEETLTLLLRNALKKQ